MRKSFPGIVAVLVLAAFGLLMACSVKYSSSYDGLVVVPSQGSAVMQSFSLDLQNGHVAQIYNVNGPPTPGIPTQVILDPAGAYAYVIVQANAVLPESISGVATYNIVADGKLGNIGNVQIPGATALAMDSAGKFLFVATNTGSIYAYAIGANAALTQVGKPVSLPFEPGGQTPSASALVVTRTIYPSQFAYCSGVTPPTTKNLYVTDSVNYVLLNYSISTSGALTLVPFNSTASGIPTGTVPLGVAVDPCNRFVYVANGEPNNTVSAYQICSTPSLANNCPAIPNYSLQAVTGSPYPAGDNPGPIIVDPYGKYVYALDTGSNQISGYEISSATGALTAFTGAPIATNLEPTAIAIRSDDSWVFVTNLNSANISEYSINQATGILTPLAPITSFNYPSGVAVK
jgi:6-phosphogluconolactonase (cycloisomerase 2 family)